MKTKDKKSEFLSVRVSPAIKKKLESQAKKEESSLSWIVSKILEEHYS